MDHRQDERGAVPVLYCERQRRWLPIEGHVDCEYCAGPVFDESDQPVSFLCTCFGERRLFDSEYRDPSEEGRGPPARPMSSGPAVDPLGEAPH